MATQPAFGKIKAEEAVLGESQVMSEWSVRIEVAVRGRLGEDDADMILKTLRAYAPALSLGPHELGLTMTVRARSPREAVSRAVGVASTLPQVRGGRIVSLEAETVDDLDRELGISNAPDLVGVAELAELLNVSKARASELARKPDFPRPWVTLKAGPIWRRGTLTRFVHSWDRRPGRPRKDLASAPPAPVS